MAHNTFYIKTMGCKSNQYESAVISEKLINSGYLRVDDIKQADFYIINSCSVTQKSDNEVLYLLRNAKNINNNIKTIITGCLAQLEAKKMYELDYVDFVFGNENKFDIPKYISDGVGFAVDNIMDTKTYNYQSLNKFGKTRISVKIQDGCDNRCAYCVIPFARGHSRSADAEYIIKQLNDASLNGFKEAVLTGIHIGQWGKEYNKSLLDLLVQIEENSSIYRYRLGSLNPLEITDELLNFLKNSQKFCPHFHMSLQSASNNVLKSMNRFYTVEHYLDQIECISEMFNSAFIGSDIIAGFVGESEIDFEETVNNLKKSKLSKIHVFPYSVRKNTQAENMKGHLTEKIKNERAEIIKSISKEKFNNFIRQNIGTVQEILIEKKLSKTFNKHKGVTRNYLNINLNDEVDSVNFNSIKSIKITECKNDVLWGNIVN